VRKLLPLLALALGAGVAHADNGMLYIGAGLTNDNLRDIAATNSNLNSTNWKVWAGVRPISLFAVEADYIDLGSQNVTAPINFGGATSNTHLSYKAFTGYAVGYLPIPVPYLDVFGKVGLARWTSSGSTAGTAPRPQSHTFSFPCPTTARSSPGASAARCTSATSGRDSSSRTSASATPAAPISSRSACS
jgi:hypothetical protein